MWSNFQLLISRSEAHKLLTTTHLKRGRTNTNTQPFKPTEKRRLSHKGKREEREAKLGLLKHLDATHLTGRGERLHDSLYM